MFKQPTGKQEEGKGETEEEGAGVGRGTSTSYARVTPKLTRPFSWRRAVSLLLRGVPLGQGQGEEPSRQFHRALPQELQWVGDVRTDNHGRPLSKPSG